MEERVLTRLLRSRLFRAGAVLAGLAVLLVYASLDEPPPEVGDLVCSRAELPAAENGLLLLDAAGDEIYWPEIDVRENGGERTVDANDLASGDIWNADFAREVLAGNRGILSRFEECLKRPGFQVPEFETIADAEEHCVSVVWSKIAALAILRSRIHLEEGRAEEAFDDAWRVVTFGHRLERAQGRWCHFNEGRWIKVLGLIELVSVLQRTGKAVCRVGHPRELAGMSGNEGLECALNMLYAGMSEYMDFWREHLAGWIHRPIPWIWKNPFCMKPNQTKRLLAENLRVVIASLGLPTTSHPEMRLRGISTWELPPWLPYPNALGKTFLQQLFGSSAFLSWHAELETRRLQAATLVAIRCYQARHDGALPPSLDDLVPDYLDAVPRDPFDGKPLRYSAEKRIVYSVGNDGKDSGGSARPEWRSAFEDEAEPTLRIESPPRGG